MGDRNDSVTDTDMQGDALKHLGVHVLLYVPGYKRILICEGMSPGALGPTPLCRCGCAVLLGTHRDTIECGGKAREVRFFTGRGGVIFGGCLPPL
jgi:hypothetical protein